MPLLVVIQPTNKKGKKMAIDSLASKLKMPMKAGGAQGGKKSIDDELDDTFGAKGDDKEKKFDPELKLGEATVDQLQAALDAKQKEEDAESADDEKKEEEPDEKADESDTGTY